jgi:hypothetical protein
VGGFSCDFLNAWRANKPKKIRKMLQPILDIGGDTYLGDVYINDDRITLQCYSFLDEPPEEFQQLCEWLSGLLGKVVYNWFVYQCSNSPD